MTTTIKDIGEIELLNRLKRFMRFGQIDDDLAEIKIINKSLLINTDLLVEKIHLLDLILQYDTDQYVLKEVIPMDNVAIKEKLGK